MLAWLIKDLERYQEEYRRHGFERYQARYRRRRVLAFLRKYRPSSILEVGCGDVPIFTDVEPHQRVVVVEPGSSFYAKAVEAAASRSNVRMVHGSIEECFSRLEESFDCIIVSSLLHEVEEPAAILRAVHSLSSGTTVTHVNVPNAYSFHRWLAVEMGLIQDVFERSEAQQKLQQPWTFDRTRLRELVTGEGFDIIEEGSYFVKPFTHDQLLALLDKGILPESVLDGLDRMARHLPDLASEIYVHLRRRP